MTSRQENQADEVRRLRNCISDLVSLLALPAMWTRQEPREIARTLIDSLFGMLRLDFVYARLESVADAVSFEAARIAGQQKSEVAPEEVGRALEGWLTDENPASPLLAPNLFGEEEARIVRFPVGIQGDKGLIVAGSRREDFPTDTETLLLNIAANQVAIALEGSNLVIQRRRAEQRLNTQYKIARALNESVTLDEVTPRILEAVCRSLDWEVGLLWTLDPTARALRCVNTWRQPGANVSGFEEASCQQTFLPDVGLPGRVWSSGEPVWVSDLTRDDNFPRASIAARDGLRGAFGFPILRGGEILGVIEFFSKEIRPPDEDMLLMMATAGSQVGQFIERRHAEEVSLHQAAIVESSDDAIISKSLEGIILSWNKGAERIFGYSAEEVVGKSIYILIPPDRTDEEPTILDKLKRGERIDHYETVRMAKDGRRLNISLTVSPIKGASGKIIAASKIARDITKQKQMEQEREQLLAREQAAREQAEEANRLKDEFLATVSHELRTPLNAMLGWTRMLRVGKLEEQTYERALETIERNAKSQAQLIEDLLDVSRIVSGKMRLDVQPVEIAPVIQAAIDSVRPAADAKAIRLNMVLDPRAGPVSGDPTRLQQIVWNLLSNAIKFTPKEGRVQVRLERVDSHIEITVSDTGMGISPEFLPYVFDRFRQADSTLTRRQTGLGLGLAIVRHLVELHGGNIHAYSAGEGQGASFTIKLPLMILRDSAGFPSDDKERKRPTAWPDVPFECPAALDGLRVLVMDDEPDARRLLSTILGQCKAEVTVVASVAEALDVLKRLKLDIVVSDIEMPGEDGYSFIRRVRAGEGGQNGRIPAVALTAHAGVADRMRALSAGFDIHVPKPVEPAELVAVIASIAARIGNRSSS